MDKAELEKKSKDELIQIVLDLQSEQASGSTQTYNVGVFEKLKEKKSLQSHIEKIHKNSLNVSALMFAIYNLDHSDEIFQTSKSTKILDDITKLLKSKIRDTDILIIYKKENFIIIAPNTDIDGADRYAHKLNRVIESNIFGDIAHLKSNFSLTAFSKDDTINSVIERLEKGLIEIKADSSEYFIKV